MGKTIITILIHLVTTLIIMMISIILMVFFYDYSVLYILFIFLLGCFLLFLDYIICIRINKNKTSYNNLVIHTIDLLLLIPQFVFLFVCFLPLKNSYSMYEICLYIAIIIIDTLLATERILLFKSLKRKFSNSYRFK